MGQVEEVERNHKTKYIIWGTGYTAAEFTYHNKNKNRIDFYVDNYTQGEQTFCGKKVLRFCEIDRELLNDHFIIVATREQIYPEIKKQLKEIGCREFFDYAFYQHLGKKIAMLHGNCHMDVVKRFLLSSRQFKDRYCVYPNLLIQDIKEKCLDEEVLQNLDLFIHQDIRYDNCFGHKLSDEYILPKLKKECLQITVPNLFGLGSILFPQSVFNKKNPVLSGNREGYFPHADIIIDKALEDGKDIQEILEQVKGDVFSREEILDNFRIGMEKIAKRELNWDVKIYDFIMENYRKIKLFYNIGHPTNMVMREISLGIMKILEISDEISCNYEMDYYEEPVYDCVKKVLGLEWENGEIRKKGGKMTSKMMMEEYVKEYLFWCHQIDCTP